MATTQAARTGNCFAFDFRIYVQLFILKFQPTIIDAQLLGSHFQYNKNKTERHPDSLKPQRNRISENLIPQ